MTKRPLPGSRHVEERRSQRRTRRVALAFVLILAVVGLTLLFLA